MNYFLLQSGPCPAAYNMAMDEALLQLAPMLGRPVLRFYGWTEEAATFGYSQSYTETGRNTLLRPLIRRPTGGGLVPHDADWTYSLAFPPEDPWYQLKAVESYQRVHEWICDAFAKLNVETTLAECCQKDIPGQCFVGWEKFDVLWHGKKIAGAAQRRTKTALLIQGSVQPPPVSLARADWETAMCAVMKANWTLLEPIGALENLAQELRETKYSQPSFNQQR